MINITIVYYLFESQIHWLFFQYFKKNPFDSYYHIMHHIFLSYSCANIVLITQFKWLKSIWFLWKNITIEIIQLNPIKMTQFNLCRNFFFSHFCCLCNHFNKYFCLIQKCILTHIVSQQFCLLQQCFHSISIPNWLIV